MCADPRGARPVLRDAAAADDPFLRLLFAATHGEFGVLPAELADSIMAHQYEMRERQYRARYPTMVDKVIEIDGRPTGRLSVAEVDDGSVIVVVDIAVLPEAQRRGIASATLAHLMSCADERRASIELSVAADSRAVELYRRLGFASSVHAGNSAYLLMWRAPG